MSDNISKTYLLIDGSYYIFYRYYALLQWWKNAKPEEKHVLEAPQENSLFVEKFKTVFKNKLIEIPKKLKLKDPNLKIFIGKDCPREEIWRMQLLKSYKGTRVHDDSFMGGEFFKLVYQDDLFLDTKLDITILECDHLEADDCLALFVQKKMKEEPTCQINIIASDHDYLQLVSSQIHIYNLKFKNLLESKNVFPEGKKNLFLKTIMGDKSDNIPSIFPKCGIKTALKCYENPEYFKTKINEDVLKKYELNNQLVNFDLISPKLKEIFYIQNKLI